MKNGEANVPPYRLGNFVVRKGEMVGLEGVEPPTLGLGNQSSIHLSYSPATTGYYVFTTLAHRRELGCSKRLV